MAIDPRVVDTDDGAGPNDLETDDLDEVNPDEDQEAEGSDAEDEGGDAEGDGSEGDEAGGDAEGDGTAAAQRPARRVAGQGRYQRLANENRELRGKVTGFERQLQELVNRTSQPSPAEQAANAERERAAVEMMSPAEVAAYYAQKTERTINERLSRQERVLFDRADKTEYDALLRETPAYRRYDERVEELRGQAPGVPRRILLATAIGLRALDGGGAARTRATNSAAAAGARQRARPTNGRGDVRSERTRGGGGSAADRLRGQLI